MKPVEVLLSQEDTISELPDVDSLSEDKEEARLPAGLVHSQ